MAQRMGGKGRGMHESPGKEDSQLSGGTDVVDGQGGMKDPLPLKKTLMKGRVLSGYFCHG